jgi:predicted transcriptional regulator
MNDKGNTYSMKTAISLPKGVFCKAERLAIKAGKSRSQLYSEALREYVARHSPDEVTEALDRIIEENGKPEERFVTVASAKTLALIEW